ncbi:MAG: lamin tail domain-containing protein, partial [Lachnospiraceae bacterium]|nr:lamin tail domain-containing protein [Lachnospiraceae bacterium]
MKKESLHKVVLFSALSVLTGVGLYNYCKTPRVVINEVCSNNFAAERNENNEYPDYIELYNPGKQSVSLEGCFLSDDEKELEKYSLEKISIPPGGYTLIWLDKDSAFRISREGEKLFLTDALHGTYLDQV